MFIIYCLWFLLNSTGRVECPWQRCHGPRRLIYLHLALCRSWLVQNLDQKKPGGSQWGCLNKVRRVELSFSIQGHEPFIPRSWILHSKVKVRDSILRDLQEDDKTPSYHTGYPIDKLNMKEISLKNVIRCFQKVNVFIIEKIGLLWCSLNCMHFLLCYFELHMVCGGNSSMHRVSII